LREIAKTFPETTLEQELTSGVVRVASSTSPEPKLDNG
jgi:hypothetical protein